MTAKKARTDRPKETVETSRAKRPERVSMAGDDDILGVLGKESGYHYHWINDDKSKLIKARRAWYEFVLVKDVQLSLGGIDASEGADSPARKRVGDKRDGSPLFAYLMRIKDKYYEEDQAKKQDKILDTERKQTLINASDGQYAPKQY